MERSDQIQLVSSEEAGTTLFKAKPEQPRNGGRATASNVQDGAADGEQNCRGIPTGYSDHVDQDSDGESARNVESPLEELSDPAQHTPELSAGVDPRESYENGEPRGYHPG